METMPPHIMAQIEQSVAQSRTDLDELLETIRFARKETDQDRMESTVLLGLSFMRIITSSEEEAKILMRLLAVAVMRLIEPDEEMPW